MRRALLIVGLIALGVMTTAPGASAHALLESSSPEDGELLETAPEEITFSFSEPLDLGLSTVEVVDSSGNPVETGELERVGSDREVRLELPADLADGVYSVSWRVLSRVDGHVTAGAFTFGVGVAASEVPPSGGGAAEVEVPDPTPLSVAGRWGLYWGLAIMLGGAVAGLFVFGERVRGAAWLLGGGWVLGALGLLGMLIAEAGAADIGIGTLLASDRGELLLARGGVLLLAGIAAAVALARPGAGTWGLLGGVALAAMLVHAYAGHAGAGENPLLAVGVQWVHIVAVGVWAGGLAWLLVGLVGSDPDERGPAAARFSRIAGWAIVFVAITGFLRAWSEVGSIGKLFDSGFGLAAVGKSALFGGMLMLGAYNRFRLIPRGRLPTLRRTVSGELALAVGVFGLTGIMAGLVPPAQLEEAEAPPAQERLVVEGSDFATTVQMRLIVVPGAPGPNTFEAQINDFDTGEPVEAREVTLRFSLADRPDVGTTELVLEEAETGVWRGQGTNLSAPGTWRVGVLIQQADDAVRLELELVPRAGEPQITVIDGGPGQPDIYVIPLGEERTVQAYVDPGTAGPNEVHYTYFDETGGELPIEEISITATPPEGEQIELEPRRLTEGHFVASADLEAGTWTFTADATTEQGTVVTATFEEEIE